MAQRKAGNRTFSREFKLEAVRRLHGRPEGMSAAHVAREVGVRASILLDWAKQVAGRAGAPPSDVFPGQGRQSAAEEELRQLRRDNARLQQENEFLKKAAAYFAQGDR